MSEQEPSQFSPGRVVFFKEAHVLPSRKSPGFKAGHGFGFGLLLGMIPPFAPLPPEEIIFTRCAEFGMVTIDSIYEFLGKEAGDAYVEKFKAKWQPVMDAAAPAETPKPAAPALVGVDGQPLSRRPTLVVP